MSKGPLIRFECPNGHGLQVKPEAAGQRGNCPECGAPVVAPRPAERKPEEKPAAKQTPAAEVAPDRKPEEKATVEKPTAKPVARPVARPVAKPVAASDPTPPPPPVAAGQWYLRSSTGEQFGPATDEQFCQWITDRRVGPENFVWREGWPDWRQASQVASELPAPLAPSAPKPPGESAADRYRKRKRRAVHTRSYLAILLLVMTLGLGGVLAYILARPGAGEPAADPPPRQAAPPEDANPPAEAAEVDEQQAGENGGDGD